MSRTTYPWQRGSVFWFQIALPKDLRALIGKTPIRYRLPTQVFAEAGRAARILAGSVERRFSEMRRLKFLRSQTPESHFAELGHSYWVDDFYVRRKRLEEGFLSEIEEILKAFQMANQRSKSRWI